MKLPAGTENKQIYESVSLTYRNEVSLDPSVITDCVVHILHRPVVEGDGGMCHVGELSGGVVAPDDDVLHLIGPNATPLCNLYMYV